MSPTERSLKHLRKHGYIVEKVEIWNHFAKQKKDLFNLFDIIALRSDISGITFIQTTTYTNFSTRKKKILSSKITKLLLLSGNIILLHGWYKKNNRWILREEQITLNKVEINNGHLI